MNSVYHNIVQNINKTSTNCYLLLKNAFSVFVNQDIFYISNFPR